MFGSNRNGSSPPQPPAGLADISLFAYKYGDTVTDARRDFMRAMLLIEQKKPLIAQEVPIPVPGEEEILVKIEACGVCRTDLHIAEGDLPLRRHPLILGHQAVGTVVEQGKKVPFSRRGERVGVYWLASACGRCRYCRWGKENLCDEARFTGYDIQGGFAEYLVCRHEYVVPLPKEGSAVAIAPLLCAGLIGFRAYKTVRQGDAIGLYGFGSSAHILLQVAKGEGKRVYVFTRKTDGEGKRLAEELGAFQVCDSDESPNEPLDGAVIFAPSGDLPVRALQVLGKGGICVSAGIHMSDIPSFPYKDLFFEKVLTSVSHVKREDAKEFFSLIETHPVTIKVHTYPLEEANRALSDLKEGKVKGSIVLSITSPGKDEPKK